MPTLNEDLRDVAFSLQGRRLRFALWIARHVRRIYDEQWSSWISSPRESARLLAAPQIASAAIRKELQRSAASFYMASFDGSVRAIPGPIVKVLADRVRSRASEAEELEEERVPGQDEVSPARGRTRKIPQNFPIKFAQPLFDPPTTREIESVIDLSGWASALDRHGNGRAMTRAITTGLRRGDDTEEIARKIRPLYTGGSGGRSAAMRIARTEVHRVNQRMQERGVANATRELLEGYRYVATLDARTRKHHADRDGNRYSLDDPRPVLPDGWNCRCTYLPVTKSWTELGAPELEDILSGTQRASVDGTVPNHLRYAEWFDQQAPERQVEIVGRKAFDSIRGRGRTITWAKYRRAKPKTVKRPPLQTQKGRRIVKAVPPWV